MKFSDILVEATQPVDLKTLADEIEAAGPQVLDFFLNALSPAPTK